ncbi:MAG: HAD family phosphatase [Alphaproteobacteria bacterium]|jgi:2-haloacid dehalogenase
MKTSVDAVVFDLGGVLIDWDPRYLYRKLFPGDEAAMEHFLSAIIDVEWNLRQDAGRSFAAAVAEASTRHPQYASLIKAYDSRWEEMLNGPINGSVTLLDGLRRRGVALYGLTNWSKETFPIARARFDFLAWFEGIVVSGEERLIKPDPAIFHCILERYGLTPATTLFIDDSEKNVVAARDLGFHAHHFRSPEGLGAALNEYGLL